MFLISNCKSSDTVFASRAWFVAPSTSERSNLGSLVAWILLLQGHQVNRAGSQEMMDGMAHCLQHLALASVPCSQFYTLASVRAMSLTVQGYFYQYRLHIVYIVRI